jgi:pyruvate carboxylase
VGTKADVRDFEENPGSYDLPDSVIGFLEGELGVPPGGWPEPFRTKALAGRKPSRKEHHLTKDDREVLANPGIRRRRRLNHLLFPGPTKEFDVATAAFGDISVLDTYHYLYGMTPGGAEEISIDVEKGVKMLVTLEAIGEPDDHGMRTLIFSHNGQIRPVGVRDETADVHVKTRKKADPASPGDIAAPFTGAVTASVEEGATVSAGDTVATIEAMKMEAAITTPVSGIVKRVLISQTETLSGGDLILVVG